MSSESTPSQTPNPCRSAEHLFEVSEDTAVEHTSRDLSPKKRTCEATSPEPDAKRPKVGGRAYTEHPHFWSYNDICLLQIGSTRFRLHMSRLSKHSLWFKRLFRQSSVVEFHAAEDDRLDDESEDDMDLLDVISQAEVFEGCKLYYLDSTGITLEDFEILLSAMDDSILYSHRTPAFPVLAAILRASTILKFDQFRTFARKILETTFSDALSDLKPVTIQYAADAVKLGRDFDVPRILKRAFYELARTPAPTKRITSEDTDSNYSDDDADYMLCLDPADLITLSNLQKNLVASWPTILSILSTEFRCPRKNGALKSSCKSSHDSRHWHLIHGRKQSFLALWQNDVLNGLEKLKEDEWKRNGYCDECVESRKSSLEAHRRTIWGDMDLWLSLY